MLLTTYGRFDGHADVRRAAALLASQVPDAKYRYTQRTTYGDVAFLEWTATGRNAIVPDGADSFLMRNDRIQLMTIHYTVRTPSPTTRR